MAMPYTICFCFTGGATRIIVMAKEFEWMLLPSLKTMYKEQSEVDLALVTEDKEVILCHSLVAAANSAYIKQCLQSYDHDERPVADTNAKYCLQVNDVKKNHLSGIVNYFYTGEIEITPDDITELLLVVTFLQINDLIEKSCDIVHQSLCIHNYDSFLQLSKRYDIAKLQEVCYNFMVDKFPEFMASKEMTQIDGDTFVIVLKENGWRLESEDMLLDDVVRWLQSNSEGVTTDIVERLLDCVPFDYCTSQKVYEVLDNYYELFASAEMKLYKKCLLHLCFTKIQEQRPQEEQRPQGDQRASTTCENAQLQNSQV